MIKKLLKTKIFFELSEDEERLKKKIEKILYKILKKKSLRH